MAAAYLTILSSAFLICFSALFVSPKLKSAAMWLGMSGSKRLLGLSEAAAFSSSRTKRLNLLLDR
jgi:hypothetical protein